MKSPQDMRIIQIDITNACIHNCSNCTRFCGHHKKPFFMDVDTFKKAVDSMEGYVGTVSMMGGEPTIHPHFEEMLMYLGSKFKGKNAWNVDNEGVRKVCEEKDDKPTPMIYPQKNFMDTVHEVEMDNVFLYPCESDPNGTRQTIYGTGLWSAMGEKYKQHYELIQDTVDYQALNDHSMPMYHQPALISRKSLGIPDKEWLELRDNCWIQNLWSACITPKGAFFCEVAGALDMLFDGPGGWPIEPGWWKRTPEEFGDQLHWCELCGLALDTFTRNANEEVDDVSPDIYEKLKEAGSRKVGTKHIHVVDIHDGRIDEESKAGGRWFEGSMPYTESYVAKFDRATQDLSYKKIIEIKVNASDSVGATIADALQSSDQHTYALITTDGVVENNARDRLNSLVLNPGTLLFRHEITACEDDYFKFTKDGYAVLLCGIASSIKKAGWDRIRQVETLDELKNLWEQNKVISFSPDSEYEAVTSYIDPDKQYVIYGAGETAPAAIRHLCELGTKPLCLIDKNPDKWGKKMMDIEIFSPEFLKNNRAGYDQILIASTRYFSEIRDNLLAEGFTKEDLCWWM